MEHLCRRNTSQINHKDANNVFGVFFPKPKGKGGNHEISSLLHSLIDMKACITVQMNIQTFKRFALDN